MGDGRSAGLAAVVSTSATAFAAIKLAGAAYLVYLGLQALRSARADRVGTHGSAGNLLLLGLLFNAMGVGWLICYATAVARGRNVLVRPRVKRTLDRISALVLVGLGTRLALENR